ncbi:MAG: DNA polymerase Y family protein [Rhodocyclaceae bacterium]
MSAAAAPPVHALWLCLHCHRLPLEVFAQAGGPAVCVAQQRVLSANLQAEEGGIRQGVRLAAALSLLPGLVVFERDVVREYETLHGLACWAGGFSPHVHVAGADELLMEIGGCLRLFGGLRPLCQRVQQEITGLGFDVRMALAPTPRAAQWLARAGQSGVCLDAGRLQEALSPLPVGVLGLSQAGCDTLAALGVSHLGGLFALPRAGLARRFGLELPAWLARALGEVPDLREPFVFPEAFTQKLELPAKVSLASMLMFAARRLLASLSGWLAARASGVSECSLLLLHEDGIPPTRLVLAFAEPTRELARMERVLRERLDRCALVADAVWLVLEAKTPVLMPGSTAGLFAQSAAQALGPVVERLRARLGKAAVHGLAVREDHRPEHASAVVAQGAQADLQMGPPRPFWLLSEPRAIAERKEGLHYKGRLHRVAGPERIESGWWCEPAQGAGEDVRRDYYVAVSEAGEWLWIFRDKAGWWLHGVFA